MQQKNDSVATLRPDTNSGVGSGNGRAVKSSHSTEIWNEEVINPDLKGKLKASSEQGAKP